MLPVLMVLLEVPGQLETSVLRAQLVIQAPLAISYTQVRLEPLAILEPLARPVQRDPPASRELQVRQDLRVLPVPQVILELPDRLDLLEPLAISAPQVRLESQALLEPLARPVQLDPPASRELQVRQDLRELQVT